MPALPFALRTPYVPALPCPRALCCIRLSFCPHCVRSFGGRVGPASAVRSGDPDFRLLFCYTHGPLYGTLDPWLNNWPGAGHAMSMAVHAGSTSRRPRRSMAGIAPRAFGAGRRYASRQLHRSVPRARLYAMARWLCILARRSMGAPALNRC